MHTNHRSRMRERFIHEGSDHYATHELLEMILYYGKPQGDTNPCAHELVERFGGIKGILEASVEELQEVKGVGEHTAILFNLITELLRRYEREIRLPIPTYDTLSKMATYMHSYFVGRSTERLYMMVFNNRMNLIDFTMISKGSANSTDICLRRIEQCIFRKNGTSVILAHNHPNGLPLPSNEDLEITESVYRHLASINITLIEHLIFTDDRFFPIMKTHFGSIRQSPAFGKISADFYGDFYDVDDTEFAFPKLLDKPSDKSVEKET